MLSQRRFTTRSAATRTAGGLLLFVGLVGVYVANHIEALFDVDLLLEFSMLLNRGPDALKDVLVVLGPVRSVRPDDLLECSLHERLGCLAHRDDTPSDRFATRNGSGATLP
jgi:hypothetical protein